MYNSQYTNAISEKEKKIHKLMLTLVYLFFLHYCMYALISFQLIKFLFYTIFGDDEDLQPITDLNMSFRS